MLKTLLMVGLGLIALPAIAAAQAPGMAGDPNPYAGGDAATSGLGQSWGTPYRGLVIEEHLTRQNVGGRDCSCCCDQGKRNPTSPSDQSKTTGSPTYPMGKSKSQPGDRYYPQP